MALPATLLRDWTEEELDEEELDDEEEEEEFYPSSDGEPMAETEKHWLETTAGIECLRARYADRPDVYVAGDNFIYYVEGNPNLRFSPDCYVIFGAEKRIRDSYKAWEDGGRLPAFVIEYTSRKTRKEDNVTKFGLYERLGVLEYIQFDPSRFKRRRVRLKGWRLNNGKYEEIPLTGKKFSGRLFSEQLQLELVQDDDSLRLFDPKTGEYLRRYDELEQERKAERQRAEAEAQRAEIAEAELARLRAELEALRQKESLN